jgi:flagellar L-ring protein precursor FlgH
MKQIRYSLLLLAVFIAALNAADKNDAKKKAAAPPQSPLDRYVAEAEARRADSLATTPGSIWIAGSRLADAARDVRASQTDDMLTIVVAEAASAVTSGATSSSRKSSTANAITSLLGIRNPSGPLANLANVTGDTELAGQGSTTRTTTLTTTLTARVTAVLPNGGLVVEAAKDILINSEHQIITVRGVVRPADIDFTNSVQSTRLAQLELRVNGKGVVGDAIRRPNVLYRFLLGLLPF